MASALQTVCVGVCPLLSNSTSVLVLSAVFGFGFAGNMTCLVLCVRDAVPAHRFGSALGTVMLVAWAGMGIGGYAGGVLFDRYLSYTLPFTLASGAGVLNLIAIGKVMVSPKLQPQAPRKGVRNRWAESKRQIGPAKPTGLTIELDFALPGAKPGVAPPEERIGRVRA